jgi:signal transduction histidine kinase
MTEALRPPLLKRLTPAHWAALDAGAMVVLLLGVMFLDRGMRAVDAGLVVAAVLPAALRRRWPRAALAVVTVLAAFASARSVSAAPALATAFIMYLIPLRFPRREALWLLAGSVTATAVCLYSFGRPPLSAPSPDLGNLLLECGTLIGAAWALGYAVRQQRFYDAAQVELREQQVRDAAERRIADAQRAQSAERLRIARELHDVVAHAMSVIAVQAGVANYVIGERPEEAPRALASIEATSRAALQEMRALLGVLRADADLLPAPGLADLSELIDRTADAGVRVDLLRRGEPVPLPAGLDLAAYRVVQEAITNVIKHAGAASCRVTVDYRADTLALEIVDQGAGTAVPSGTLSAGGGHGLVGMRERVGMYGGALDAGPLRGGGFRVAVSFPLTPDPGRPQPSPGPTPNLPEPR